MINPNWRYECVSLGLDREILLTEDVTPKKRYCILPDLPETLQSIPSPETIEQEDSLMLEEVSPGRLQRQGISGDRYVQIPEEKMVRLFPSMRGSKPWGATSSTQQWPKSTTILESNCTR